MPDPVPKAPGRPPGEPIIIRNPPRPPEAPEIDRSEDGEDDPGSRSRRKSSPKSPRRLHPGSGPIALLTGFDCAAVGRDGHDRWTKWFGRVLRLRNLTMVENIRRAEHSALAQAT